MEIFVGVKSKPWIIIDMAKIKVPAVKTPKVVINKFSPKFSLGWNKA